MDGDDKKIVFQLIHAGTKPVILLTDNIKSAKRFVCVFINLQANQLKQQFITSL